MNKYWTFHSSIYFQAFLTLWKSTADPGDDFDVWEKWIAQPKWGLMGVQNRQQNGRTRKIDLFIPKV